MKTRNMIAGVILSLILLILPDLLFVTEIRAASRESAEDAQVDVLIAQAKTKADHLKIAAIYRAEAKSEEAKAQALRDQAEAYKEHKHDVYGRNLLDLMEHTDALARTYQEAADRHEYLAHIHEEVAGDVKR